MFEIERVNCILVDFGNRNTVGRKNVLFWPISIRYFEIIGTEIGCYNPWRPLIPEVLTLFSECKYGFMGYFRGSIIFRGILFLRDVRSGVIGRSWAHFEHQVCTILIKFVLSNQVHSTPIKSVLFRKVLTSTCARIFSPGKNYAPQNPENQYPPSLDTLAPRSLSLLTIYIFAVRREEDPSQI